MGTLRRNVAGQHFFFQMRKASDGLAFTDTVTGTLAKDAAADAALNVGTTITHLANGKYRIALAQTDTDAVALGFSFTGLGALPITANFLTTNADPQDGVRLGLTALPNATPGGSGGLGTVNGANVMKADITEVLTTTVTEGSPGRAAGNWSTFWNNGDASSSGLAGNLDATVSSRSTFDHTSDTVAANVTFWQGIPQVAVNGKPNVHVSEFANNAITAASITAGALNGKGDWNIGKTGYSLAADQSTVTIGTVNSANVTAWDGSTGAVKVGATSGLPQVDVTAWQDRVLGATNMIEADVSGDRWTFQALSLSPSAGAFPIVKVSGSTEVSVPDSGSGTTPGTE